MSNESDRVKIVEEICTSICWVVFFLCISSCTAYQTYVEVTESNKEAKSLIISNE